MKTVKKILIAEDDHFYSHIVKTYLTREGYEVEAALDGSSALNLMMTNDYDLVLLDILMPGLNGFDVLRELRNKDRDMNIVVLSNLSQKEDEMEAMKLGVKGFFVKVNHSIEEIIKMIRFYIN